MFRWYRDAAKCYAFLSDVSTAKQTVSSETCTFAWEPAFVNSRWFTRGWTLQELLAPRVVIFFSREGDRLGDRLKLKQQIHEITNIPVPALAGTPLGDFSVDERLSWSEKRYTTRKEDKAYSLLGIFGIYMPLIYGEGQDNAFRRLRKGIEEFQKECSQRKSPILLNGEHCTPTNSGAFRKSHKVPCVCFLLRSS
jgi:hypothetical protein